MARRPRTRPRHSTERQDDLEHLLARLHGLGASPSELRGVRDTWGTFDDDWTPARRAEVVRSPDAVLRTMLVERRAEYPYEPPTPDLRLELAEGQVVMGIEPPAPAPPRRKSRGAAAAARSAGA